MGWVTSYPKCAPERMTLQLHPQGTYGTIYIFVNKKGKWRAYFNKNATKAYKVDYTGLNTVLFLLVKQNFSYTKMYKMNVDLHYEWSWKINGKWKHLLHFDDHFRLRKVFFFLVFFLAGTGTFMFNKRDKANYLRDFMAFITS